MKRNYLKLFFGLFSFIIFMTNINAGLVCNSGVDDVTINETDITYAGFEATMPKCTWIWPDDKPMSKIDEPYDTYKEAYDSGFEVEIGYVQDYDAKGISATETKRCSSKFRTVSAEIKCTQTKDAELEFEPNTCPEKLKSDCTDSCSWDEENETCIGDNSYYYFKCPKGFKRTGKKCKKEVNYNYENITAEQDVKSNAENECKNGGYSCICELPKFYLYCPKYKCEKKYINVSACTPDFEIDGQPAYCVNPSQQFNKPEEEGDSNYQYDSSFNVLNCASSYSTVDCGYANILIEGAYYDAPDDAINTALRLWSIHSGQAGSGKTGIANLTGKNCDDITYFTKDDNKKNVNVYKRTHDYIMDIAREKFYDVAKRYTHIPEEASANTKGELTGNTFEKITCSTNKSMAGVMCGDSTEYRVGFELFFNTLIGNKYMKEHLASLYGGGEGVKPIGATLQSEYSIEEHKENTVKESWIEVKFEHESFWNYVKDEEVGCSDAKLNELKNKLLEEGKSESEADAIINQIKPYCKVKVTVVDEDGNVLVTEKDMEKCIKGSGCRTKKFKFAICDITENSEKDIAIKVKYERTRSSYSVRKYISCANANINQTLFAFFKDESDDESGNKPGVPVETSNEVEDTYSVTNYKCSGGCDDASVRTSGDASCKNDSNNYNGVYTSTVKDPSLKCIVNLNDSSTKTKYDYSDYFGVNTNFCRVYCSDEVEYVLADKVRATSGRSFNYNIEFSAKGSKQLDYNLTTIVKQKRSCVSEIYYNHLQNLDVIRNDYGLNEDEFNELKKSKTFAGLYKVLRDKAISENEREEILNQLIYDIYNCNFYTEAAMKRSGVDIPRNYKSIARYKIDNIYKDSNNYGLGSDKNGNKTDATNTTTVKYEFGAKIKDSENRVNNVNTTPLLTGKLSPIRYCKDETGKLCYEYDSSNDENSYSYPENQSVNYVTYTLFKKGNQENEKTIKVPTNDYARFDVTTEIDYYNNNKYQLDYGSGKVFIGDSNADLMTLASFSYPIDKDAYNLDACNISIENGKYHRCTVNQVVNQIMFYRNDNSYKLTVNDSNNFKCYVDVEIPAVHCDPLKGNCSNATLYRNVDPANLFPSGNLKEKSNWSTEKGLKAKESIESTAHELKTNEIYLDYSITLNPNQIKNIKKYNDVNSNYIDEVIYNCEKDSVEGIYTNCRSHFMDILRGNTQEYPIGTYGNINADRK